MAELIDEISHVQETIAPHVGRYAAFQRDGTIADGISIYAAHTSVALAELNSIVESHQRTRCIHPGLDDETFEKAEKAIDMIRHTQFKLHQRAQFMPQFPLVDMGLESAYQKGQSWLLTASQGTDYADALLWQYTNQHTNREGPGVSDGKGGSRQLWPPAARTMNQTREYLNPPRKWLGERKVEFENCTHTLEDMKEIHREWAIEEVKRGEMSEWERDIIGKAVERSGVTGPALNTGVATCDGLVEEETGLYALGSDDGEEEEDVGLGSSRSHGFN